MLQIGIRRRFQHEGYILYVFHLFILFILVLLKDIFNSQDYIAYAKVLING